MIKIDFKPPCLKVLILYSMFFNQSVLAKQPHIEKKETCICDGKQVLGAAKGIEIYNYMKNELRRKMAKEKLGDSNDFLFPSNDDGSFEYQYDEKLFNAYSDFLERDLRELNREPTYLEMQNIINYRKLRIIGQRLGATKDFFSKLFGPKNFEYPSYEYLVFNGKIRENTSTALKNPIKKVLKITLNNKEYIIPPDEDQQAWLELYKKINNIEKINSVEDFKSWLKLTKQIAIGCP